MNRAINIAYSCLLVVLQAWPVFSAQVNTVERWDTGQLNGWTDEVKYLATLANPGTYLQLSFPAQNILMPAEDGMVWTRLVECLLVITWRLECQGYRSLS